jgi:hypothetical protein
VRDPERYGHASRIPDPQHCTKLKERFTDLNMTSSLPADGAFAEETANSFKQRQLAQPWKFFQPLHQLLLKKIIL